MGRPFGCEDGAVKTQVDRPHTLVGSHGSLHASPSMSFCRATERVSGFAVLPLNLFSTHVAAQDNANHGVLPAFRQHSIHQARLASNSSGCSSPSRQSSSISHSNDSAET